jgi:hypothetical protein
MIQKRLLVLLLLLFPFAALPQSESQLVEKYAGLAGSEANARTLVSGLRDGNDFTIGSTSFDPPTGKMGYGEIDTALALAQKQLPENATPEQLEAALVGTAEKPGVLAMRADGMGWGQIAQAMGFKLGEVKRSPQAQDRAASGAGRPERMEKPQRPDKPERPFKPERPERPVKPERPAR